MSDGTKKQGAGGAFKGIILVAGLGIAYLVQKFTGIDILSKLNKKDDPSPDTTVEAPKEFGSGKNSGGDFNAPKENKPRPGGTFGGGTAAPEKPAKGKDTGNESTQKDKGKKGDDGVANVRAQFKAMRSKVWVTTEGKVSRLLRDDTYEPRHQQFLLKLAPDLTVKVAHNIDDAPYLTGLKVGDFIKIQGRYEYGEKGGVIHFTHRADRPTKRKPGGWIDWNGKRYQ